MNLGDPELELIDPTPNVHALFIQFDRTFFWAKLASRAVVRWSKRMYSCAGVCSYEGRGGLCDIALSEPLLKLRPRKDLVETLLHEMIHAFLFITLRVQDRDGHGPSFKEHMYRINKAAGINISIYHNFHEEVELYQIHWWRCNGPCQLKKPHFGIVQRSSNTAPGPRDYWWVDHQRKCGGTFIKIKEPEKTNKKKVVAQPKGDITKYITSTKKVGEPQIVQISDIKSDLSKIQMKSNNSSTVIVSQKGVSNPINKPIVKPPSFLTGKGYTIAGTRVRSNSADVTEMVRNVWAKKQLTSSVVTPFADVKGKNNDHDQKPMGHVSPKIAATNINKDYIPKATKHKTNSEHVDSPPLKVKKIDDYFKKNAASLLKEIYGSSIEIVESTNNKMLIAVNNISSSSQVLQVDCPICRLKIEESKINSHLDECLNKDIIAKMCDANEVAPNSQVKIESVPPVNNKNQLNTVVVNKVSTQVSEEIPASLSPIPPYKPKLQVKQEDVNGTRDYNTMQKDLDKYLTTFKGTDSAVRNGTDCWNDHLETLIPKLELGDAGKGRSIVNGQHDKYQKKSDNFNVPKEDNDLVTGFSPSHEAKDVKVEPGPSKAYTWRDHKCPCCGNLVTKPMNEHLEECLVFFDSEPPLDEVPANLANHTIILDDDDDIFDETQVLNATGTKLPCPCCMQMVENDDMNTHLDDCLS